MPKRRKCLTCPVCTRRNRVKRLKLRAYGSKRQRVWCGRCDRFFGPVGSFSKKAERQRGLKQTRAAVVPPGEVSDE